jgi:hypothetical protein
VTPGIEPCQTEAARPTIGRGAPRHIATAENPLQPIESQKTGE